MSGRTNPNRRTLLFAVGASMAGVGAARAAFGLRYKLHTLFDFHTVVNAGAWGDLGVAAVSFLLGFLICRAVVREFPPTAGLCVGLALITSMAILLALGIGTGLGQFIRLVSADLTLLLAASSLIYSHVTTLPTLIVLMAAWTGVWVMLCSEETGRPTPSSSSPPITTRNIRARYHVWIPPADLRIVAPRWWLALTFGDDIDVLHKDDERKDGPGAAT
ncbi:MAG: hypothetical protein AB7O88_02510 [Reyranellaceae bacterium]